MACLSGSGDSGSGYSLWIRPPVAVKLRGWSPQACSVQNGAPEPPEKRLHCALKRVTKDRTECSESGVTYDILVRVDEDLESVVFELA